MGRSLTILLLISTVGFLSCKGQQNQNTIANDQIDSIYVSYYNYIFETVNAIDCENIKVKDSAMVKRGVIPNVSFDPSTGLYQFTWGGVLDTTITNPHILNEIDTEIHSLQVLDSSLCCVDARISCLIYYKNGTVKKLCIGGYFADMIQFDGYIRQDNNKLLYLIKKNINYYFHIDDEILEYMKELKDAPYL